MTPSVYFDGECGMCSGAVAFARRNRGKQALEFVPLASPEAFAFAGSETIVLVDAGGTFERSDAVLRLAGYLRAPWPALARPAWMLPRPLRDGVYRWIAANRHRLGRPKRMLR